MGILLGSGARESVKTEQTFSIRMTKDEAEGWVPAGKNLFLLDMRFKPEEEKNKYTSMSVTLSIHQDLL